MVYLCGFQTALDFRITFVVVLIVKFGATKNRACQADQTSVLLQKLEPKTILFGMHTDKINSYIIDLKQCNDSQSDVAGSYSSPRMGANDRGHGIIQLTYSQLCQILWTREMMAKQSSRI